MAENIEHEFEFTASTTTDNQSNYTSGAHIPTNSL